MGKQKRARHPSSFNLLPKHELLFINRKKLISIREIGFVASPLRLFYFCCCWGSLEISGAHWLTGGHPVATPQCVMSPSEGLLISLNW